MLDDQWDSLHAAWSHARLLHGKDAERMLIGRIATGKLALRAQRIEWRLSQVAYEFPVDQLPIQQSQRPEVHRAYRIAYGEELEPRDGSFQLLRESATIFVWGSFETSAVKSDVRINLHKGKNFKFDWKSDTISFVRFIRRHKPLNARYQGAYDLELVRAEGACARRSDLDKIFPYSTDYPMRKPPGRPPEYDQGEVRNLLMRLDPVGNRIVAELKQEVLDYWAQRHLTSPSEGTVRSWINRYQLSRNK